MRGYDLGARGAFLVTFFIAKKVTQKSSRSKNSRWFPIIGFISCFAATLVGIPRRCFLNKTFTNVSCFLPESALLDRSDSFERQVLCRIRDDFFF